MQRVKGIEKLLLGGLTLADKLHVVDHQNVHVAESSAKLQALVLLNGVDKLVGEGFAGNVHDGGVFIVLLHIVADGMHQMGFAKAHAAVDKQRVIGCAGVLRHGLSGSMRKVVRGTDHKAVKGIFRIQRIDVDGLAVLGTDVFIPVLRKY